MSHKKISPREKRKIRIRRIIKGTSDVPRLNVFRSNRYLYVQLIDDVNQKTLLASNTLKEKPSGNKQAASWLGQDIAVKATEKQIKKIRFDRAGYQYHGVIKEIAEAARKAGLEF